MTEKTAYRQKGAIIRTKAASRASAGETVALALVVSVAAISVAIGAWSLLAFINSLAIYGVDGVVSGFFRAVTGQ